MVLGFISNALNTFASNIRYFGPTITDFGLAFLVLTDKQLTRLASLATMFISFFLCSKKIPVNSGTAGSELTQKETFFNASIMNLTGIVIVSLSCISSSVGGKMKITKYYLDKKANIKKEEILVEPAKEEAKEGDIN